MSNFMPGFLTALAIVGVVMLGYKAGSWETAHEAKRQCETQGSFRLETGSSEFMFYCSRTPSR